MIIDLDDAKRHLRVDFADDDQEIATAIMAAQGHIENVIGGAVDVLFPDGVPDPLQQAARMLVGMLYGQREAIISGNSAQAVEVPLGFNDMIRPYRCWSFG